MRSQSQITDRQIAAVLLAPADLCHPTLRRAPFTAEGWLFELKHDGFRAFARKSGSAIELMSRSGRSLADAFPEIIEALRSLNVDAVLDAELVVPDVDGRSDFDELCRRSLLQRAQLISHAAITRPAALIVFD